ncbi:divalent-cation tolerance protein CutA [bacterium CPR1]|nr:divalent-cation tolerance protein CutA [bacterium CPR1]
MSEYCVCLITASSPQEARNLAYGLVESGLAACVNRVPQVTSVYSWMGKVEEAGEILLIAKTTSTHLQGLIDKVKELHSYDVPEVVALPIVGGNRDYLRWIDESVR